MPNILIVEDDEHVRGQLERDVAQDGHRVTAVACGCAALEAVALNGPDLIVLDLNLPDIDGIEVCRRIRERRLDMPILILTVKDDITTTVLGLESGADDYVTKPFTMQVLLARIRRHASRFLATDSGQELVVAGRPRLRIDLAGGRVRRDDLEVDLTCKQFEILALLVRNADQVVARDRLLTEVWGYRPGVTTRTIDTHVAKLRQKLERDPANPERIVTAHGRGYKFVTTTS